MQAAFVSRLYSNPWPSHSAHRVIGFLGVGGRVIYFFSRPRNPIRDRFQCQPSSIFTKLFCSLNIRVCSNVTHLLSVEKSCLHFISATWKNSSSYSETWKSHKCPPIACSSQKAHCSHAVPCTAGNMVRTVFHSCKLLGSLTMPLSNPVCKWYSHSGRASTYAIRTASTASSRSTCTSA